MNTYKVVIYEYADVTNERIIGSGMNERQANRREETGLMRTNENFGVKIVCEQTGEIQ